MNIALKIDLYRKFGALDPIDGLPGQRYRGSHRAPAEQSRLLPYAAALTGLAVAVALGTQAEQSDAADPPETTKACSELYPVLETGNATWLWDPRREQYIQSTMQTDLPGAENVDITLTPYVSCNPSLPPR